MSFTNAGHPRRPSIKIAAPQTSTMSSRVTMQQPAAQAAQARRQQLTAALPAACSQQQQLPAACAARQARPQRRSGPAAAPAPVAAAAAVAALLPAAPAAAAAWAQPLADLAEAMDEAPVWTLDQAVGLVFAGLLLALYLGSTQVRCPHTWPWGVGTSRAAARCFLARTSCGSCAAGGRRRRRL